MLASYHNHTFRCNHATGSEEEYVLRAIKSGYRVFGFSDHAPHSFQDPMPDSRMRKDELSDYVTTVSELREKYKDLIDIKIGLELEYFPLHYEQDIEMYKSAGIEYLILGQHVVSRIDSLFLNSFAKTGNKSDYTAYVNLCSEALETGGFCYFAHPDVFFYKGDDDFYREESDRLIRKAMELDIPLELNMLGLATKRHYPNPLFWERVSALGAKVILGHDAHDTERVHNKHEMSVAAAFVKKYKLRIIDSIEIHPLSSLS